MCWANHSADTEIDAIWNCYEGGSCDDSRTSSLPGQGMMATGDGSCTLYVADVDNGNENRCG